LIYTGQVEIKLRPARHQGERQRCHDPHNCAVDDVHPQRRTGPRSLTSRSATPAPPPPPTNYQLGCCWDAPRS